jgi:hypothetical protein
MMRPRRGYRASKKSKVLKLPSYHIVAPPLDVSKFVAALERATQSLRTGLAGWISKEEAKEFFERCEPQDFPMKLFPEEGLKPEATKAEMMAAWWRYADSGSAIGLGPCSWKSEMSVSKLPEESAETK